MKLVKNDTVLFLGDSITDCDRDRQDPHDLGHGFARLVADQLAENIPHCRTLPFITAGSAAIKLPMS
ncbi:MAG: hypothetical protein ACLSIL_09950 [Enterococcus casseliflavus]